MPSTVAGAAWCRSAGTKSEFQPAEQWTVIHHGLTFHPPALAEAPGEGVRDSVDIGRLSGRRLMVAAKTPNRATEIEYFNAVIKPALGRAGSRALGGLSEADRDALVAGSWASLVPSTGPELFGLVVIEALACGTPVSPAAPVRSPRSCATG